MTREALARYILTAPPRVALMIEALACEEQKIVRDDVGQVALAFAYRQVKLSVTVSLGCYKLDKAGTVS